MSQEYEVYEAYIDGHEAEIEQGKDFPVEVKELSTLTRKVYRARVAKPPKSLLNGHKLWVKDDRENLLPEPWTIEIIEELDEDVQLLRDDIARGKTQVIDVW